MRKEIPFIVVLVGLTLWYTWFFAHFHVDPHHDGIILKPALDVVAGKNLFIDTFTQYGALTTLIQVGFMKVFGATLLVQRLSAVLFYGLSAVLLFACARKFLSTWASFGIGVMWLLTAYFPNREIIVPFLAWSSVYALTFQLASIFSLFQFIKLQKKSWILLSGVCAALTFWARQPVGIFLLLSILAFLSLWIFVREKRIERLMELGVFLIGALGACLPFILWLATTHALHAWWNQSIVLAFHFGNNLSGNFSLTPILAKLFPSVLESKKNLLWLAAIFSSWTLFGVMLLWIGINKTKAATSHWIGLALSVTALASWMQFFPANDQSHFFWAGTIMLIPLVLVLSTLLRLVFTYGAREYGIRSQSWIRPAIVTASILAVGFLSLGFIVTDLRGLRWYRTQAFVTLHSPPFLGGIQVAAEEKQVLDQTQRILQAYFSVYPDKTAINVSPDALYALLDPHLRSFHPLPVYWDWTLPVFPDYQSKMTTYIETYRPLLIVRDSLVFPDYCQIDVSSPNPGRIAMFGRPLLIRIPVEDVLGVKKTAKGYRLMPHLGSVTLLLGGKNSTLDTEQELQIATSSVTLHSPLAGDCVLDLP